MADKGEARRTPAWVTSLHSGGCSACAQSIAALEAPRHARNLRAHGITLARSPRHSNVLLLCGALTEQARLALAPLIEGTPRPRALVAVGDCALNGCVFAGSPALTVPIAQAFEVNVEIGGCPPAPEAILAAIVEAQRLLAGSSAHAMGAAPAASVTLPSAAVVDVPAPSVAQPVATDTAPSAGADRASRLASLLAAAGSDWDDELDEDELDEFEAEDGDHLPHDKREHHLTEHRADPSASGRQRRTIDE